MNTGSNDDRSESRNEGRSEGRNEDSSEAKNEAINETVNGTVNDAVNYRRVSLSALLHHFTAGWRNNCRIKCRSKDMVSI